VLHDPDSSLYESISVSLQTRPFGEWVAPLFPPHRFKEGLFQEHTAVFFWANAMLGRMGFGRATLLMNFAYFLLSLFLLGRIAEQLTDPATAWLSTVAYLLSPLGLQYLLRGNHENAWGAMFLAGLYCLLQIRRGWWWGLGRALAGFLAVAIKGALALSFFPTLLVAWWLVSRRAIDLVWFLVCLALIGGGSLGYEAWYQEATGQSFFAGYLSTQIGGVMKYESAGIWSKAANIFYYLGNLAYFALPSSILALWGAWRTRREGQPASPKGRPGMGRGALAPAQPHVPPRSPVHLPRRVRAGARPRSGGAGRGVAVAQGPRREECRIPPICVHGVAGGDIVPAARGRQVALFIH
jgi:hypothetical protein